MLIMQSFVEVNFLHKNFYNATINVRVHTHLPRSIVNKFFTKEIVFYQNTKLLMY